MNNRALTGAQAAAAVVTILCGVVAAAGWIIVAGGRADDLEAARGASIERRLAAIEQRQREDHGLLVEVRSDVEQIVSYLAGRGPRPLPAINTEGQNASGSSGDRTPPARRASVR